MSAARVADILADLVEGGPPSSWPDHLVHACRDATDMTGVGLALVDGTGISGVLAVTGGAAERLEELQSTLGEGPCVDATRTGRPVLCPDLATEGAGRWPAFTPGATELGVAAAFTFPLQAGAVSIGVLDLYRSSAGPLADPHLDDAVAFADAGVAVLLHLHEGGHPVASAGLADLVDRRAVVHQAAGMVSVQLGVEVSEALLRLRTRAWARQSGIADVAADVVARRVRFDDSETGTAQGVGGTTPDGQPGGEPG